MALKAMAKATASTLLMCLGNPQPDNFLWRARRQLSWPAIASLRCSPAPLARKESLDGSCSLLLEMADWARWRGRQNEKRYC